MTDLIFMFLGFFMFAVWGYNYYCVFKNKKNTYELVFGILGLIFLILFIIGSTAI